MSLLVLTAMSAAAREYHVSINGSDMNDGSKENPLRTINAAAQKALPGDAVIVHAGVYREWINPLYGGTSNYKRITYEAAENEKVEIKGSEIVKTWVKVSGQKGVWKAVLNNSFFGAHNPYCTELFGDWLDSHGRKFHTGDVYLNDVSLYEAASIEKVYHPDTIRSFRDPEGTQRVWFATVDAEHTTIYANFGDANPNKETVEIAARPTCFYPTSEGLNYITIRGFRVSQAATQWGAPTAEQIGMIATHWCKGWIIENNIIKNSRCNGISLGKERSTGHNLESTDNRLDGFKHYIETIFNALRHGWNRDNVGSHIVRNNTISDCEQTAICGSMGGAFCEIYGNHIYNIWVKKQFSGAEMAGIKLHAAIDTYIHNNRIHHCGNFGIWLDWMAEGTRISSNLFYDNDNDIFFEVDHGPFLVDNNLFLSKHSISECSDGGAFVHNLIVGSINPFDEPNRYTPYHLAHSTEVKGFSTIINGDHRYYNNVFIGGDDSKAQYGLSAYNKATWPIFAKGNLFLNGAKMKKGTEENNLENSSNPKLKMEEKDNHVYLSMNIDPNILSNLKTNIIDTQTLGTTKLSGLSFELSNGDRLIINKDYLDKSRSSQSPTAGPFENVSNPINVQVW
jgi:hypothetical protein